MAGMSSRPVQQTQVYNQDTEPTDTRDGVLWVDTSTSPPDTYSYDASTGTWEPVAPGNVTISDTQPTGVNNGHLWVDTTANRLRRYDGANDSWDHVEPLGERITNASSWTDTQNTTGKALMLNVTIEFANDSDIPGKVRIKVGPDTANYVVVAQQRVENTDQRERALSVLVPDGYYYTSEAISDANGHVSENRSDYETHL
jgi:hypothetical protein